MNDVLFHERTLLGAIDSYLKGLVHVRPHYTKQAEDLLEEMAEQWLAAGRANALDAVDNDWLHEYVRQAPDSRLTAQTIGDFYRWARKNGLSQHDPFATAIPTGD